MNYNEETDRDTHQIHKEIEVLVLGYLQEFFANVLEQGFAYPIGKDRKGVSL